MYKCSSLIPRLSVSITHGIVTLTVMGMTLVIIRIIPIITQVIPIILSITILCAMSAESLGTRLQTECINKSSNYTKYVVRTSHSYVIYCKEMNHRC